ncbi:hypothetical protein E0494_10930 [Marinilabiliaceae bacterium JC040]|nr:hypothetical protein [Marinilabiliaceae bacterium JC040]
MKYKGMTVNERLYVSGLMDEYDKAVEIRDIKKVTEILKKVKLEEVSIDPILKRLGLKSDEDIENS